MEKGRPGLSVAERRNLTERLLSRLGGGRKSEKGGGGPMMLNGKERWPMHDGVLRAKRST